MTDAQLAYLGDKPAIQYRAHEGHTETMRLSMIAGLTTNPLGKVVLLLKNGERIATLHEMPEIEPLLVASECVSARLGANHK